MFLVYLIFMSFIYKVDPILTLSVAKVESDYRVRVIGDNGKSFGMLQVKCIAARDVGYDGKCKELRSSFLNIKYGVKYLAKQLNRYELWDAISAYNAGRPLVCKKCKNKRYVNSKYVNKVKKAYLKLTEGE